MKKMLLFAFLLTVALVAQEATQAPKTLHVLMIGNSFTNSVLVDLPNMANADKSVKLVLRNAYIGGCSIQRHLEEYDKSAANPNHRPYRTNEPIEGVKGLSVSLQECLKADTYDIVSIQQASRSSWQIETYGADAKRLIDIVRQYQPKAEIVGHQTWAYRADSKNILPGGAFNLDQLGMHNRITECYKALQKEYGFRIIPVGNAVQIFRTKTDKPYTAADVPAQPVTYTYPDLPPTPNDVVGNTAWGTDKKTGERILRNDPNHLNRRGQYLQACVWYMFLFDKRAKDVNYIPEKLNEEDAKFLAKCAEEAILSWK